MLYVLVFATTLRSNMRRKDDQKWSAVYSTNSPSRTRPKRAERPSDRNDQRSKTDHRPSDQPFGADAYSSTAVTPTPYLSLRNSLTSQWINPSPLHQICVTRWASSEAYSPMCTVILRASWAECNCESKNATIKDIPSGHLQTSDQLLYLPDFDVAIGGVIAGSGSTRHVVCDHLQQQLTTRWNTNCYLFILEFFNSKSWMSLHQEPISINIERHLSIRAPHFVCSST